MTDPKRARARALAAAALADGAPLAWFEPLYREAAAGTAVVPWDDRRANPLLLAWLDRHAPPRPGARALDVGCGTGDNAGALAARGWAVTAFDVAPTAVAIAADRFPEVTCAVASALDPPAAWRGGFDLVVEIYTLQVLPPAERAQAARALAALVAPGGTLLVIARAREVDEPAGAMPWPLIEAEVRAIAGADLACAEVASVLDDETPPVRRWVAAFTRPAFAVEDIDHVQLAMPAGGEDRARAFYRDVLELPEVPKPAIRAGRGGAWFERGPVRLHLGAEAEFRAARKAHPALRVRGLAALIDRCRAAGYAVSEIEARADGPHCYVDDPFGNRIELLEFTR
jgi:SAM-dependent methyltransferase